ncbi:uncharacterized protein LOC110998489 [Pieris rapae]|uniref:uncharacterized protein LOC110998489 n=1 Tax=Pieris rapae TaxID=64459 RepID=UPI001E27EF58|nr:uncharacterized protein LOC110998489 [Pieris rapae]XP_022122859.2 uncharacterized protein LOC110998489 [Pieris rapae]XP_045486340.1 uncharacterized protein LOC110998489 [Pieris rapae]
MCGEKQSIKRHYGIGSGKECRLHVQKLNKLQSENHADSDIFDSGKSDSDSDLADATQDIEPIPPKVSKWSHYTDENDVEDPFSINCRGKEEIPKTSENKIFHDKEQCNSDGSVIKQCRKIYNNQNKRKYESSKFVKPSSNKQRNSFNETNKSSEWATFVENNSQEGDSFIHGDNLCVGNKFLYKDTVNSCSKWVDFLDNDDDDEDCIEQHANSENKIICKESNMVAKTNNSPTKDNISHDTNKILLNLKQSDTPGISKTVVCKESIFSMSDDQDLDSILDL